MNVQLEPGKYIVAVSGGVDSMSLLHVLKEQPGVELVVAHFDHGIRDDSAEDANLVRQMAHEYGLPYELGEGKLGANASEADARNARYAFLQDVRERHDAQAIITAHHQDDVLETAILNLLRGTGRKGLTSLSSREGLQRPMLHIPKAAIKKYAKQHNLTWREDSTNSSDRYTRNYVRNYIMPRFSPEHKAELLAVILKSRETNEALDGAIKEILDQEALGTLDRHTFIMLPHAAAREVLAAWLRAHNIREFDKYIIERLVASGKTGRAGSRVNVYGQHMLVIDKHKLALSTRDR
ncbi:MAG: tRNA lysidine(34) synthetase TilS [Candidatus Saccharimonadales bacterium]